MDRLIVQKKHCEMFAPLMSGIARCARQSGIRVHRWQRSLATYLPYHLWMGNSDLAIVHSFRGDRSRRALMRSVSNLVYVEMGWYPQKGTFQLDPAGINADVSWAQQPLQSVGQRPISVRDRGDLLILLQHERDTQIRLQSPSLRTMADLISLVAPNSCLPVRVRAHPRFHPGDEVRALAEKYGCTWDASPSLQEAIGHCRAVACINSSSAVECLTQRLPVLCFGNSIYRHAGVVYGLDADGTQVKQTIDQLAAGHCSLYEDRIEELLKRIWQKQWTVSDIPQRLPTFLNWVEQYYAGAREPEPLPPCNDSAFQAWAGWNTQTDSRRLRPVAA